MDRIPDLGQIGKPQQLPLTPAVLLRSRPEGLPPELVTGDDLLNAIVNAVAQTLRPIIREEIHAELGAALALSEG